MIYVESLASVGHGVSEKLKRYAVTTGTYTTTLAEINMILFVVFSSGFCKNGCFQPQSKYRVNKVFQRTTLPESSIQPLLLAKQPIEYEATEPFFGSKSWYATKGHTRILKYFLSCMSVHYTSCLVLPLFVKSSLSGRPPSTSAFS